MFAPKGVDSQAKTSDRPKRGPAAGRLGDAQEASEQDKTPRHVEAVLEDAGDPLDPATRGRFQSAYGHDFARVRVHTDDRAAASAANLSARAYTVGPHIVFGRGQYAPDTGAGRRLIAHELAHVVQQSRGGPAPGQGHIEAAADRAAGQAMRGIPVRVAGGTAIGIACKTLFEEFTDGKYMWSLLKAALEHTRPVADILDDLKALQPDERAQAIKDISQERAARDAKQADLVAKRAAQADPTIQAVADPMLVEGRRVADRMDAVLIGLRGGAAAAIPGWNFTPDDYSKLQAAGQKLTMAPDSGWFPAKLQQNLINTLDLVLGPRQWPMATEGVNATDFFHGHLVVKKAKATESEVKKSTAEVRKWEKDFDKAQKAAIGEISFSKKKNLTADKIGAYKDVVEKAQPPLAVIMEEAMKLPGAAVMYHTFEFNQPRDLKAQGQKLGSSNPRRHYVTPLDTNVPEQYTPPDPDTYEKEYTIIAPFSFLVDGKGAVHVRLMRVTGGISTLELSTITGKEYPAIEFE
jgi:hypothetical protein